VATLGERLRREEAIAGHELRLEGATPRFLQINAVALRDSDDRINGAVLVFHDFTRIRELEKARQEFVANVSHELRTPLSLIKGAVEMLLDGATEASRERLLQIVDRHADRLVLLIDDLLLLAQLDSGRVRMNWQTVAGRGAVQEVIDDLALRADARAVTLHNDVPDGLLVRADADRVRQVFFNLIDNALKYGKPGGNVHVSAVLKPEQVEFAVRDDGPGIPPDAQARIFERFYRVDKARSREQGGTGLGLAIVKHVVQAHGGEVRVASTPGQGATFHFTLKRADAAH
jgi:two-component system phosphate regulon sensor histidine kinase PhoR